MGRRRRFGRTLNGVLLVDKAAGMTSNAVVQEAKSLFFAAKAGHTGALDPLATGVLPVCFGEATKFSQFLLDADKEYESTFCLGVSTDTLDADGRVLERVDTNYLTREQIEGVMASFRGEIEQVPPMYSALKKDGQALYKLARAGVEVERQARSVTIFEFSLLDFASGSPAYASFRVKCSKGTYVRSLAHDIGQMLNVGAHVDQLRRVAVGRFHVNQAHSLATLAQERGDRRAETLDHHLLSVDTMLTHLPSITLGDESAYYFRQGQPVMDSEVYRIAQEGDTVRVFCDGEVFLGLGKVTDDRCVAPKRLVSSP